MSRTASETKAEIDQIRSTIKSNSKRLKELMDENPIPDDSRRMPDELKSKFALQVAGFIVLSTLAGILILQNAGNPWCMVVSGLCIAGIIALIIENNLLFKSKNIEVKIGQNQKSEQ